MDSDDTKQPTAHLINLTKSTLFVLNPQDPDKCEWEYKSYGELFLDYPLVAPSLPNVTYGKSNVTISLVNAIAPVSLNTSCRGYNVFIETVTKAHLFSENQYDLFVSQEVAEFLGDHPELFDCLKNIRLLFLPQGNHIYTISEVQNPNLGYPKMQVVDWKARQEGEKWLIFRGTTAATFLYK